MRKPIKWLVRGVLAVVVLVVLAAVGVYFYIDTLAEQAIERGGTYATGVETRSGAVRFRPFSGAIALRDLTVANPDGFEREHFLKLDQGRARVTLGSLLDERVVIPRLALDGIELDLARNDAGKANHQIIMEHLEEITGRQEDREGKRYVIEKLDLTGIKVYTNYPIVSSIEQPIVIEDIHLEDVGSDTERGVLMSQLSGIIVRSVMHSAARQLADILPADVIAGLDEKLKALGPIGDFTTEQLDNALKNIPLDPDKLGEDVKQGIDNLLNNKSKTDPQNQSN